MTRALRNRFSQSPPPRHTHFTLRYSPIPPLSPPFHARRVCRRRPFPYDRQSPIGGASAGLFQAVRGTSENNGRRLLVSQSVNRRTCRAGFPSPGVGRSDRAGHLLRGRAGFGPGHALQPPCRPFDGTDSSARNSGSGGIVCPRIAAGAFAPAGRDEGPGTGGVREAGGAAAAP